MASERDLQRLLHQMNPVLQDGEYVFCSLPEERTFWSGIPYLGSFHEKEGVTVILEKDVAQRAGIGFQSEWKMITLTVHSALDAVGFLATITGSLAAEGIAVNVISAYYHDHLFLSAEQTPRAMEILKHISRSAPGSAILKQESKGEPA